MFVSKSVAAGCVVAVALLLVPGNANAGKDGYTVKLLSNPDEAPYTYANAINNAGRIVGAMERDVDGDWVQTGLLWKKWDADPVELAALPKHTNTAGLAINDKGQICGFSTDWWFYMRAVLWDNQGNVKDMHPDFGRYYSQMWDINRYGDAVGIVYVPGYSRAFIHPDNGNASLLELDTDVYVQSWPYEINKKGAVAGFARYDAGGGWGPTHACFWDEDGDFEDLHDDIEKDLGFTCVASKAWAMSDSGEVGGVAVVSQDAGVVDDARAFVWTGKDGFDWVDSDGSDLSAIGGGGGKRLVGVVDGVLQTPQWYNAYVGVWTRGTKKGETVWNLETLPMAKDNVGMISWRVNTSGRVVGIAVDKDGYWSAFYATK